MSEKRKGPFFVLVVPEVNRLDWFVEEMSQFWKESQQAVTKVGFKEYPTHTWLDVPEEAALEFASLLAADRMGHGPIFESLALDVYYMEQAGRPNNKSARMLVKTRVSVSQRLLDDFGRIRDARLNPIYKAFRVGNLLKGVRWFDSAETIFSSYPVEHFIQMQDSPDFRFFGADVHKQFQALIEDLKRQEDTMTEPAPQTLDDALARRIYSLIRSYVRQKAEMKSGVDIDTLPKNEKGYPDYPKPYLDAKEKAASSAFLAMRGRHREDFIEYFTGTICAVPQWLPEEDYLAVSRALVEQSDTVKNLAMLALSAHSYTPNRKNQIPEADQ
jgi:CRISPR-associated protein Cmx8